MVLGLCSSLDDSNRFVGVVGSLGDDLEEKGFGNVVGAGAGEEEAARLENLEGAKIDLLVAAVSSRDAVAILGKGRGVENYGVEATPRIVVFLEEVKCVSLPEVNVRGGVQLLIAFGGLDGSGCHVDGFDAIALVCDGQREPSLITEAVQCLAAGVAARDPVVFALVEEGTGLLSFLQVVDKRDAVLLGCDLGRDFTVKNADALVEGFEDANPGIISFEDAFGREKFDQDLNEHVLVAFSSLAQRLDDEVIAIAVDNEGGKQVRFAVNQAVRFRVFDDSFAIVGGARETCSEKGAVDCHIVWGDEPDRDLRFVAEESAAVKTRAFVCEANNGARFSLR